MFPKFTDTSSFDFGMEPTILIKDIKSLEKRAAARHNLKYAKTKGQEDMHLIAVGAYEGTGFNRNMDRFVEKWCEKNAHYFRDSDRCVHRHHKNKKDDPKYGNVKAAAYNKEMRRIELIVGLDKEACADILHEQEKVGHTNWSMASKQAFDTCTWCGFDSHDDKQRCSHIPDKLGEMNKEGQLCGMDNPDPRWFEISYVKRPADRIGMSLNKMASARLTHLLPKDYLQIYTGFEMPTGELIISKRASEKRALLKKLSELEKVMDAMSISSDKVQNLSGTEKIASTTLDELRQLDVARFFKMAADKGIILSADNFFSYVFGDRVKQAEIEGAKTHLYDIFQTIEKDASEIVNNETFDIKNAVSTIDGQRLMNKLANSHSMLAPYVATRQVGMLEKSASARRDKTDNVIELELAKQYANYKLATAHYLESQNKLDESMAKLMVLQNRL